MARTTGFLHLASSSGEMPRVEDKKFTVSARVR